MTECIAIFGATSAVAQALAWRYAARGAKLALVGRNAAKLAAFGRTLGDAVVFEKSADLDLTEQTAEHVTEVFAALGRVDVLICAHGYLGDQLRSEYDLAEAEQIARTNYTSVMAILVAAGPRMKSQASGQIAVITSVAAERGRPRNYTYAAAKAALNIYVEGLHSQLYASGVRTTTIKLGPVDTPMTADHAKNALFSDVETVALQIERAIRRRVRVAFVPRRWRFIMAVVRNVPEALFQRVSALSGR